MGVRKRPRATAEVVPPRHRYPTRWKLRQEKANVTVQHIPCKRKKVVKCILYLPRDILFSILLLVPATLLHKVVTYVCKQWNDIVNDPRFIKAHCQLSSVGLLVQKPLSGAVQVYYIEGDNSTEIAFPLRATIFGSFNGLVLFQDLNNTQILSVINPLTKVKIDLPPVQGLEYYSSIGFAITSCGHYKAVVVTVCDEDHSRKRHLKVFTIGIDKAWRFVDFKGNSKMECIPYSLPLFIAGMWYWCDDYYPCFAMDVDTETIYHLPKPDDSVDNNNNNNNNVNRSYFISLGTCLGVIQVNKTDEEKKSLWKLTDVKSGKWSEVAGININAAYTTVSKELFPRNTYSLPVMLIDDMFWFNQVVDVDGHELSLIRFNLVDQSFVIFPIKHKYGLWNLFHHVHTMLSPKIL